MEIKMKIKKKQKITAADADADAVADAAAWKAKADAVAVNRISFTHAWSGWLCFNDHYRWEDDVKETDDHDYDYMMRAYVWQVLWHVFNNICQFVNVIYI